VDDVGGGWAFGRGGRSARRDHDGDDGGDGQPSEGDRQPFRPSLHVEDVAKAALRAEVEELDIRRRSVILAHTPSSTPTILTSQPGATRRHLRPSVAQ